MSNGRTVNELLQRFSERDGPEFRIEYHELEPRTARPGVYEGSSHGSDMYVHLCSDGFVRWDPYNDIYNAYIVPVGTWQKHRPVVMMLPVYSLVDTEVLRLTVDSIIDTSGNIVKIPEEDRDHLVAVSSATELEQLIFLLHTNNVPYVRSGNERLYVQVNDDAITISVTDAGKLWSINLPEQGNMAAAVAFEMISVQCK